MLLQCYGLHLHVPVSLAAPAQLRLTVCCNLAMPISHLPCQPEHAEEKLFSAQHDCQDLNLEGLPC